MDLMTPETLVSVCISSGAVGAAGLALALQPTIPEPDITPVDHFQEADFKIYDRGFEHEGQTCNIGIAEKDLCLRHSRLEDRIRTGDTLPAYMSATSAEFPIIVRAPLKQDHLRTVRFGHTVALYDTHTRMFVGVMDLDAANFEQALGNGRQNAGLGAGENAPG